MSTNDRIDILCIESNRFVASVSFRRLNVPVLAGFEFQSVTSWTRILFFLPSISYCWRYRFDSSQMFFCFFRLFFPMARLSAHIFQVDCLVPSFRYGGLSTRPRSIELSNKKPHNQLQIWPFGQEENSRKKERKERKKKSKGERQIQQMTAASAGNKQQQPRRSLEKGPGH